MSDECLEGSTRPRLGDMLIRTELLLEAPRAHSMYIIEQPYGKEVPAFSALTVMDWLSTAVVRR